MATPKSGTPARTRATAKRASSATSRKSATSNSATATATATATKAGKKITAAAESFIETVKSRPLTSAAIAAGAAGAGALIWAKRGLIAEQASALGEQASTLGGRISDQATSIGGMVSEQATALSGKISDQASALAEKVTARLSPQIASSGELSTPAVSGNGIDVPSTEQGKVGAVSY